MCLRIDGYRLSPVIIRVLILILVVHLFQIMDYVMAYDSAEIFGSYKYRPSPIISNNRLQSSTESSTNNRYSSLGHQNSNPSLENDHDRHDHRGKDRNLASYSHTSIQSHHQTSPSPSAASQTIVSPLGNQIQSSKSEKAKQADIVDPTISHPLTSNSQTARVPLYLYNPGLARQIGVSTLMYGGVLYGLTVIPAILAAMGVGPFAGLFNSLGKKRRRRSIDGWLEVLPFFDKPKIEKFVIFFESILDDKRMFGNICQKYHSCKAYKDTIQSYGYNISLEALENTVNKTFGMSNSKEESTHMKALSTARAYFEPLLLTFTGFDCGLLYPCQDPNYTPISSGTNKRTRH